MPDKHVVIQKPNSKQCYIARLASGHKNEYWVVATAPNVDVARGLVQRLNTAPEPVAPAIEGRTAHAAKTNASLRKKYKLTKTQMTALAFLRDGRARDRLVISGNRALPSLEKRGLVLRLREGFWQSTRLGRNVLEAYEAN